MSFLAVILTLLLLKPREFQAQPQRRADGRVLHHLREGLRFLLTTPQLAVGIIILAGNGAFIYGTSSIIPLIAEYELGVGPAQFGSLVMALTMAAHGRASQRLLLLSGAAFGVFYLSRAFAPNFAIGFVLLVLVGGSIQVFGTSMNSIRQLGSPDHLRGRVMSVFTLLTNGITPLGSLFNGLTTASAGIRFTLAAEACVCLVAVVVALCYRARTRLVAVPAAG